MINFKRIYQLLVATVCAIAATGCSNDTPNETMQVSRIAVIESVSESGLTFAVENDKGGEFATILHAKMAVNPDSVYKKMGRPGNGLLIYYEIAKQTELNDPDIDLIAYLPFTNLQAKAAGENDLTNWNFTPVYLVSQTVIARKLIMRVQLPYSTISRRMGLFIDPATVNSSTAEAYFVHDMSNQTVATFNREYYLCIDLSVLGSNVSELKVNINDTNLKAKWFKANLNKNKI